MYPYSSSHNAGSYSQHSHQETDLFAVHRTGAITSTGVLGYYEPLVEVSFSCPPLGKAACIPRMGSTWYDHRTLVAKEWSFSLENGG